MVWTSTYSEKSLALQTLEDEFWLHIYDPCKDNTLTRNSYIADGLYVVGSTAMAFTPDFTTSMATTDCPLTRTCYIWNDVEDYWQTNNPGTTADGCNVPGHGADFTQSFDSNSRGQYNVEITTANYQAKYPNHPDVHQNYRVKIVIEDLRSTTTQNKLEEIFDVTIEYRCHLNELTGPNT